MKSNKWLIVFIVSLSNLMTGMSTGSLTIANPLIASTFGIGIETVQWVSTLYLVVICSLMILFGRIGDRIGGQKVFITGLVFFVVGSLLCGFSSGFLLLLACRVLQALGAAMTLATGMGLLMVSFPLEQRGMALGFNVLMVGIGHMSGPSLGGLVLTHFDLNMIFFVNVPFGLVAFLLALKFLRLPEQPARTKEKLDIPGAVLLAICVTSLILCLSGGFEGSRWFGLLLIVFLPIFFVVEKRQESPLWDFSLMTRKRFSLGNLITFLSYSANMLVGFLFPFFMEAVWDFPVGMTGLFMMISPICMAVSAPFAGMLSDRIGALKLMPASLLLFICGLVFIVFWGEQPVYPLFISTLILTGLGMGILNTPNNSEIMTAAGKEYAGYTGGFVATNRNLAFCLGTAASAGLFTVFQRHFEASLSFSAAYVAAFHAIALIGIAIASLSLIFCLWLRRLGIRKSQREQSSHS
jgi:EmrB/QacA subfamily drug resistance transporter